MSGDDMSGERMSGDVPATEAPSEPQDDDLKELLAKRQHAKPNKVTWVLLVLLILALGFAMGSCVQKGAQSITGRTTPTQPASESDPAGATGERPAGDLATPPGVTVGTIESIDGTTMTITTRDGSTVVVEVPATAAVTSQADVALSDLPLGASVVIRGDADPDGNVTADSVAEGGGFPGGGMRNPPTP